jgi:hypothetical protein
LAILRASATVIHLGTIAIVKEGSSPTRRPTTAVEYNENIDDTITAENISAACLFTSCSRNKIKPIELLVSMIKACFRDI